jgi:hypothetical protein
LGLKYFKNKRITIDYKAKKIGISRRPLGYTAIKDISAALLSLLEATGSQKDLIYVLGKVKGICLPRMSKCP